MGRCDEYSSNLDFGFSVVVNPQLWDSNCDRAICDEGGLHFGRKKPSFAKFR
jgi:hypothetical protein